MPYQDSRKQAPFTSAKNNRAHQVYSAEFKPDGGVRRGSRVHGILAQQPYTLRYQDRGSGIILDDQYGFWHNTVPVGNIQTILTTCMNMPRRFKDSENLPNSIGLVI
jgi:hypothetical protein